MLVTLALAALTLPQDKIDFPKVEWHLGDALGAPAVTDEAVFSGGWALFRIDPKSGEVLAETGRVEKGEEAR